MTNPFTPTDDVLRTLARCITWLSESARMLHEEGCTNDARKVREIAEDARKVLETELEKLR